MKRIAIDLETYSPVDIAKTGVYRYASDPDFKILLFGYSVDGEPVRVVDLALGEQIPPEIIDALLDNSIIKSSFNAMFERVCLSRFLWDVGRLERGEYLSPSGWHCDMVWSGYMGLPMSLKGAGAVLGLDKQKMEEGKELIKKFCVKGVKPEDSPAEWTLFKEYNKRDVEVEMAIADRLKNHPVPDSVWEEYWLDQEINDRGILVDVDMVKKAIALDAQAQEQLSRQIRELTGIANPRSVVQMKKWLSDNGIEMESLGRKELAKVINCLPEPQKSILRLWQQLAMSAVKKYTAMNAAVCPDGRLRGMFKFYGANRTGRFSGSIVQLQNLYRNDLSDLAHARELVKQGNYEAIEALYDSVPEVLAQCVRTAFVPQAGMKFIVADFSAIEARVVAWLAGEQWKVDAFAGGKDIYCETASKMFHKPVVKHGVNGELRQLGKVAELACIAIDSLVLTDIGLVPIQKVTKNMKLWDGEEWVSHDGVIYKGEREVITYDGLAATPDHLVYVGENAVPFCTFAGNKVIGKRPVYDILNAGSKHRFTVSGKLVHNCSYGGSVGALKAFGALENGVKEEELQPIVDAWRTANSKIVRFWYDVERAAKNVIREKTISKTHGLKFECRGGMMYITLPSGRKLSYVKPRIGQNRFGGESIEYMGMDITKHWGICESFSGKLVENVTQSVSRDILCHAMNKLRSYSICAHVHDEIITECPKDTKVNEICKLMATVPDWAEGLPLRADGYECEFYRKD